MIKFDELICIYPMVIEAKDKCLKLTDFFRCNCVPAVMLDRPSLNSAMRKANKMKATYFIFVDKQDVENNTVHIKKM